MAFDNSILQQRIGGSLCKMEIGYHLFRLPMKICINVPLELVLVTLKRYLFFDFYNITNTVLTVFFFLNKTNLSKK